METDYVYSTLIEQSVRSRYFNKVVDRIHSSVGIYDFCGVSVIVLSWEQPFLLGFLVFLFILAVLFGQKPVTKNPMKYNMELYRKWIVFIIYVMHQKLGFDRILKASTWAQQGHY